MSLTTCQKVTLISCSVLCVSLFLPKMLLSWGEKDIGQPVVGPGFHPAMMHKLSLPEDQDEWADPNYRTHTTEAKAKGLGRARRHSLMGQVIPIYGFGILLYILYITHKLTCKGKNAKSEIHYTGLRNPSMGINTTTNDELAMLQEKLLKTEMMMERLASGKSSGSKRNRKSKRESRRASKQEKKLLQQISDITQMIQETRLEGVSPEMLAEEVPYTADWEGYPEETYPEYDEPASRGVCHAACLEKPTSEKPASELLTAEALAERMEAEDEEELESKLHVLQEEDEEEEDDDDDEEEEVEEEEEEEDQEAEKRHLKPSPVLCCPAQGEERIGLEVSRELDCGAAAKKQISFSDHQDVFRYPKEGAYGGEEIEVEVDDEEEEEDDDDEEEEEEQGLTYMGRGGDARCGGMNDDEDPVMEAESLAFSCDVVFNLEEDADEGKEEEVASLPAQGRRGTHAEVGTEVGTSGLRMRNRRET